MADAAGVAAAPGLPVAAGRDRDRDKDERRRTAGRCGFAVLGIMSTLLVYGVLQVRPPCLCSLRPLILIPPLLRLLRTLRAQRFPASASSVAAGSVAGVCDLPRPLSIRFSRPPAGAALRRILRVPLPLAPRGC
jgi:hypothetical protein